MNVPPLPGQPTPEENQFNQTVFVSALTKALSAQRAAEQVDKLESPPAKKVRDAVEETVEREHRRPSSQSRPGLLLRIAHWLNLR